MLSNRTREQLQADAINESIEKLTRIRNELDPSYSPPPYKDSFADRVIDFLDMIGSWIYALIGLGLLAACAFVIIVFVIGIFS